MALVLPDRVKETTTTTGTGTVTLAGATTGFQSFAAVGNGNTTYYTIAGQGTSEWEVGIGTYTSAGTTLSRDTVLASSNSGSLVNFSAGAKDVFVTYPAERGVWGNGAVLVAPSGALLPVANGGTGNSTGQAASVANAATFNNGGAGDASGTTFDGSAARTISYNTVGASPLAGSSSLTTTGTVTSGTWSASFGAVSGANLTNLTAGNLTGTIPSTVLGNSTAYVGTTAVALNRASANQALTGISSVTLPGATSGSVQLIPTAAAGTGTVITMPATTGTMALTSDIPTVNNGTLSLATSGTGLSGSATFTANQSSISTFTVTSNATNANTPSTIVARDVSGNFSAGTITATLSGNASSATNATYATSAGSATNATYATSAGSATNATYATSAGNVSSISSAVGSSYTWTGIQYFQSNKGGSSYVGSNNSYILEAYSSDAGAAAMSFHRGGYYAVNMGLDPDNVMRIGGWSASSNRWQLDMSGNMWTASSVRSSIFYDQDDTSYYLDPNSTSQLSYVLANNWFRPQGGCGVYWQSYGRGIWAADSEVSYGNITTYGGGLNGWRGYGVYPNNCILMANGSNWGVYNPSGGYWMLYSDMSGNLYAQGQVQASWSDLRIKENVREIDNVTARRDGLAKAAIKYEHEGRTLIGYGAQTLQENDCDIFVHESDDARKIATGLGTLSVDYAKTTAVLAVASKMTDDRVEQLEARVAQLEALVTKLIGERNAS